ncbi:hypothetical protein AKJ64_01510 [candidate division MSBL1 archaeon SCGC-AAA259E17]|uniref:Electron transfer flavoprotein alpha/beta-subunit N-terminal domain-containing protein n=1 Tax=candidate division MSBL1 archaeon SCGC-AAA259E17 TaxID=1698263 RepID=A0A133UFU9_9EURY|nr:hypothetical protein AKJ64_01510 [candidate division MSBL1 archaeon SCGC-AAA259E17]
MEKGSDGVWVLAEQRDGKIHSISYELLGKGRELADELEVDLSAVLLTPDGSEAEELIYRGADKVYLLEDPAFGEPDEEIFKENILELLEDRNPQIFLIGATNFGRSLAPRISAALETGLTADCTGLEIDEEGNFVQVRPAFTGNVLAHIRTDTRPQMSTVRYREFEEAGRNPDNSGEIIRISPDLEEEKNTEVLGVLEEEEVSLEDEEVIVAGGRGLKDPNDFDILRELADLLGGEIGSSRPLVDDGWIDRQHQVGYSGSRVKPKLYVACGISGASQHLAGMKDSEKIVAINTDPSAPIFDVADYGIVGDLYEVVPELIRLLKEGFAGDEG